MMPLDISMYDTAPLPPFNPLDAISKGLDISNAIQKNKLSQLEQAKSSQETENLGYTGQNLQFQNQQNQADIQWKGIISDPQYLDSNGIPNGLKIVQAVSGMRIPNKELVAGKARDFLDSQQAPVQSVNDAGAQVMVPDLTRKKQAITDFPSGSVVGNTASQTAPGIVSPSTNVAPIADNTAASPATVLSTAAPSTTAPNAAATMQYAQETGTPITPGQANAASGATAQPVSSSPVATTPHTGSGISPTQQKLNDQNLTSYNTDKDVAAQAAIDIDAMNKVKDFINKQGVSTGKGQPFWNNLVAYASTIPAIGDAIKATGATDDIGKAIALQKFLQTNTLNKFKQLGGTGANDQLNAVANATPGFEMPASTILELADYNNAANSAVLHKAAANDAYLAKNNNNFSNFHLYQGKQRQNTDPLIWQIEQASDGGKSIIANLTPAQRVSLAGKIKTWQQMESTGQ